MVKPLEDTFPGLAKGVYRVTSAVSKVFNCVAWAAGDTGKWWWPVPADVAEVFWPSGAKREETLSAFRDAFVSLGYVECSTAEVETGFEKIAIFANDLSIPLHAARQVPGGRWTSKLGELEDIDHALRDLEGTAYGTVVLVMKRPFMATPDPGVEPERAE
jgi:hypothetical protein